MLQSPAPLEAGLRGGWCQNKRSLLLAPHTAPEPVFTIPLAPLSARWPWGEPAQGKVLVEN